MKWGKRKEPQHFPVMDGAGPAPREDQIAGVVQRVWVDSRLYHQDVEALLREWLATEKCIVDEAEFELLLTKARGEFERVAVADHTGQPTCPASTLVECLYWDVERLEHDRT